MGKKGLTVGVLCLIFLLLAAGCGTNAKTVKEPEADVSVPAVEDGVYITLYFSDNLDVEDQNATEQEDSDVTTAMVTSVEEAALSAETIVKEYNRLVIEMLYGSQVIVNGVEEQGQAVKVDFDSDSVQALNIEQGSEGQLFYNLARSIDDNLGDVDDIYFTMDGGKDFTLGHLWFEADRPFYSGVAPVEWEESIGVE